MIRYIGANTYRSVTIAGTIIDKTTGEPLSARIYAMEDSTGRLLMEPTADPEAGTDSYAADSSARAAFSFPVATHTSFHLAALTQGYLQIGRASCRERGCKYDSNPVAAETNKKQ